MTVNGASKTMCSLDKLTFGNLYEIAKGIRRLDDESNANGDESNANGSPPIIYVDCNNALFKCNKSVSGVVTLLMNLALAGFVVVPVVDGTRPGGGRGSTKIRREVYCNSVGFLFGAKSGNSG